MWTYLLINLGVIFIPLLLSFERRVGFVRQWSAVAWAALISAPGFIWWDHVFVVRGVWGFNGHYLLGPRLWGLPIEEILFFLCVPFSCLFIYELVCVFQPPGRWAGPVRRVCQGLMVLGLLVVLFTPGRIYTQVTFAITSLLLLVAVYFWRAEYLERFFLMYLLSLLPFLIVNGLLTSGLPFIDPGPVVWYNNAHTLGVRVMSIPVEDFVYSFSLLLMNVMVYEYARRTIR